MSTTRSNHFFLDYIQKLFSTKISTLILIVLCFLAADLVINQVSDVLAPQNISMGGIILFIVISFIYSIGQYGILRFMGNANKNAREKSPLIKKVHTAIRIQQLILVAIIWIIIIEILASSRYETFMLTILISVSVLTTIVLNFIFSYKMLTWYKWNRNSKSVLLFGLAFLTGGIWYIPFLITEVFHLSHLEPVRTAQSEVSFPDTAEEKGYFFQALSLIYNYFKLASFILLLAATALLIRQYAQKIGKIKFWILIALPFLYYVSTLVDVFGFYVPETDNEILIYYTLASLNMVAGGILFAIPFRSMAKTIRKDDPIRKYMMMCAFGFIVFFGLNQTTIFIAPYPPYGVAAQSINGLSTYMIFSGIYSTAIAMSQNMNVRQSIRRIALSETNLLNSIGSAQMDSQIHGVVVQMKDTIKNEEKELAEKTGIETSISGEEMEDYMKTVIEELARSRKKSIPK